MRRVLVLLNEAAGLAAKSRAEERAREVRGALEEAGAAAEVRAVPGEQLAREAAQAAQAGGAGGGGGGERRYDVIAAAGGDGTQSAVAGALAGTGQAMGVLPLGTLNHFAKDLGIPLDVAGAARVIATGQVRTVDAARVNGRVFINNSSIGIYPRAVRHRDRQMERLGRGKWVAMLLAVLSIFRRFPTVRLRMSINGQTWLRTTPFVFVGNNVYHLELFNLGERSRLDAGDLCVYFPNRVGRTAMLRLALRAVVGRLRQDRDFNALCTKELWIDTPRGTVSVALDGEVEMMAPPLHYEAVPEGLKVVVA